MEVNLPELNRRSRAPRIRTRSGRMPRARFHGPGSPRTLHRGRSRLLRFAIVCAVVFGMVAVGGTAYAETLIASLPDINGLADTTLPGAADTLGHDPHGN